MIKLVLIVVAYGLALSLLIFSRLHSFLEFGWVLTMTMQGLYLGAFGVLEFRTKDKAEGIKDLIGQFSLSLRGFGFDPRNNKYYLVVEHPSRDEPVYYSVNANWVQEVVELDDVEQNRVCVEDEDGNVLVTLFLTHSTIATMPAQTLPRVTNLQIV